MIKNSIYGNALFHTKMEDGVWRAQTIKPFVLWNKMEAEINLYLKNTDFFKGQPNPVMVVHLTHNRGGMVTTWDSSNHEHRKTLDSLFCDWREFLDVWCATISFREGLGADMTHDAVNNGDSFELKRLIAAADVPEVGVKKGDKGGLVGQCSLVSIDSWVSADSSVSDGGIGGEQTVLMNSIILNGSSVESSRVKDSVISESTVISCPLIKNTKVDSSLIIRSSVSQSLIKNSSIEESLSIEGSSLNNVDAQDDSRFGASTVGNVSCVKTDFINSEIVGGFFNECSIKYNNYAAIPNIGDVHVDAMIALDKDGYFVYHVGGKGGWNYHTGGIDEQESKQLFLEKCYEKAQLMGTEMDRREFWEIAEMLTAAAKKQIACASKTDQER